MCVLIFANYYPSFINNSCHIFSLLNDHEMNWEERKAVDAEPYIYARTIKKTIHSIKDKINSISS